MQTETKMAIATVIPATSTLTVMFGLTAPLAMLAARQDRTVLRITIRSLETEPAHEVENRRIISLRCAPGIIRRTSTYPQDR